MPHHVAVSLPDGRSAFANHDDSIAKIMRRIHKFAPAYREVKPEDYEAVSRWLDENAEQSQLCENTCYLLWNNPDIPHCNHT
jgi:hypothetical protein